MLNYIIVFLKDCVDEIYDTIVDAILGKKLEKEIKLFKNETPPPMNKVLEKQPHSEAIRKKKNKGKACQLLMCRQQILVCCMCPYMVVVEL